jgi:peptidoglycan-associated lipoprotein
MASRFLQSMVVAGLTVLLAASCSRPKKTDGESAGVVDGSQAVVADKEISTDPMGSDSGKINGLNTIFFEFDQARLTEEARKTLAANAEWMKANEQYTIQIEGHTDERGSVEYNLSLGERRAKSVKSYLEGLGVKAKRMTIISYGEEKPLQQGDTEAAYSRNRRANFIPLQ